MMNNFGFGTMGIFENLAPVEHTAPKASKPSKGKSEKATAEKKAPKVTRYHLPAQIHFDSYPSLEITDTGDYTLVEILEKISKLTGLDFFRQHPEELSLSKLSDASYLLRPTPLTKVEKGDSGCKLLLDSLLESLPVAEAVEEEAEEESGAEDSEAKGKEPAPKDTVSQIKDYIQKTYGITVELHLLGDTYVPVPVSPSSGSEDNLHFPIKVCGLKVPMELIVLGESAISEENYVASDEESNIVPQISKKGIEATILSLYPEYANDLTIGIDEENNAVQIMHKPPFTTSTSTTAEKKEDTYPTNAVISLVFTRIQLSPDDFSGAKTVTKKDILRYLGKSYPEYSAERTELLYDKKKNTIMPILKSGKRGAYSLNETNDYRHESSDLMDILASKSFEPDSLGCVSGTVQLNFPKIPFSLLKEVVTFFWDTFILYQSEAIAFLFYRRSTGNYQVFIPYQTVNGDSVTFQREFEQECDPDLVPVMEIHSHGTYQAFWSSVDNEDEVSHRLYAVVGDFPHFNYDTKHILVRAATGTYHVQCNLWDIFERPVCPEDFSAKLGRVNRMGKNFVLE